MGREEQIEEREVLDSIFPNEIQDISETEYRISIKLDITKPETIELEPLQIILNVEYPPEYPDVSPILKLLRHPNTIEHHFFCVATDSQYLLDSLKESIDENMGMAMIFTIVCTLKDNAEELISTRQRDWQKEQDKILMEAEREENKKFHGTPVTPETFATWREGFRKELEEISRRKEELEELAEKKKYKGKIPVPVMTGKQLWNRGLAGKFDDEDEVYGEISSGYVKTEIL